MTRYRDKAGKFNTNLVDVSDDVRPYNSSLDSCKKYYPFNFGVSQISYALESQNDSTVVLEEARVINSSGLIGLNKVLAKPVKN